MIVLQKQIKINYSNYLKINKILKYEIKREKKIMNKKEGIQIFFFLKEKDRLRNRTLRTTELMLKIWAPRK